MSGAHQALGRRVLAWILLLPLVVAWPLPLVLGSQVLARSDTEAAIHIWGCLGLPGGAWGCLFQLFKLRVR